MAFACVSFTLPFVTGYDMEDTEAVPEVDSWGYWVRDGKLHAWHPEEPNAMLQPDVTYHYQTSLNASITLS